MRTKRTPIEALSATARADIARIRHCADGAIEPLPDGSEFAVFGLFEARHQLADAWGGAGGQCVCQMATCFAPELGIERRFGES